MSQNEDNEHPDSEWGFDPEDDSAPDELDDARGASAAGRSAAPEADPSIEQLIPVIRARHRLEDVSGTVELERMFLEALRADADPDPLAIRKAEHSVERAERKHALALAELDEKRQAAAAARATDAAPAAEPPPLRYNNLADFAAWLLAMYRRGVEKGQLSWCPEWWLHEEAVLRLDSLWRGFESLRQDPATGISVWMRDHVDHHLAMLLSPDGPFARCGAERGHAHARGLQPLPGTPPEGLFEATDPTEPPGSGAKNDSRPDDASN